MVRRILCVVLVVSLLLSFSACGNPPSESVPELIFYAYDHMDDEGNAHYDYVCTMGRSLQMRVFALSNGALTYDWEYFDFALNEYVPYKEEGTSVVLGLIFLKDLFVEDSYFYRCHVTASLGSESVSAYAYFSVADSGREFFDPGRDWTPMGAFNLSGDEYNSRQGYEQLTVENNAAALQTIYQQLDIVTAAFNSTHIDAPSDRIIGEFYYHNVGLSKEEALWLWDTFLADHPHYKWLSTSIDIGDDFFSVKVEPKFASGSSRAKLNARK